MITRLEGASVDLIEPADILIVRYGGYPHYFYLSKAEADVFRAIKGVFAQNEAAERANLNHTAPARAAAAAKARSAAAGAGAGSMGRDVSGRDRPTDSDTA